MDPDTTSIPPRDAPGTETTAATKCQLLLYAHDLKRLLARERHKTRALAGVSQQRQALIADLQTAYAAEQRKTRELEHAYADTVRRLARAARFKDAATAAHARRLGHYARLLALYL